MRPVRIIVMFDLPVGNARERRSYADFRKFLKADGYQMEQFSVYSRPVLTRESGRLHIDKIRAHLPHSGCVTVLTVTETEYANRRVLVDTRQHRNEVQDIGSQLTLVI